MTFWHYFMMCLAMMLLIGAAGIICGLLATWIDYECNDEDENT